MPKGGLRPGTGRPKGALAKKTRAVAEKAAATGMTPLEVMIDNMRHFYQAAVDAEATIAGMTVDEMLGKIGVDATPDEQFKFLLAQVKQTAGFRQMAQDAARDASPFIHPRLSAVDYKMSGSLEITNKEQRDAAVAAAARADK